MFIHGATETGSAAHSKELINFPLCQSSGDNLSFGPSCLRLPFSSHSLFYLAHYYYLYPFNPRSRGRSVLLEASLVGDRNAAVSNAELASEGPNDGNSNPF